jgi:ribosomal-protein-alanine N-acetyltransferase
LEYPVKIRNPREFAPIGDQLLTVDRLCFPEDHWNRETWTRFLKNKSYTLVVDNPNQIRGYLLFSKLIDEAEILRIATKPEYQHQSVGKTVFQEMIDELSAERFQQVVLEVREDNNIAIRFYLKQGFKKTGVRKKYYQNPICNALIFRLELSDRLC